MKEWVDVNIIMPDNDQVVLVAHRKGTDPDNWSIDTAYYCSEDKEWISSYCDCNAKIESSIDLWSVYYWQPLPIPPK